MTWPCLSLTSGNAPEEYRLLLRDAGNALTHASQVVAIKLFTSLLPFLSKGSCDFKFSRLYFIAIAKSNCFFLKVNNARLKLIVCKF